MAIGIGAAMLGGSLVNAFTGWWGGKKASQAADKATAAQARMDEAALRIGAESENFARDTWAARENRLAPYRAYGGQGVTTLARLTSPGGWFAPPPLPPTVTAPHVDVDAILRGSDQGAARRAGPRADPFATGTRGRFVPPDVAEHAGNEMSGGMPEAAWAQGPLRTTPRQGPPPGVPRGGRAPAPGIPPGAMDARMRLSQQGGPRSMPGGVPPGAMLGGLVPRPGGSQRASLSDLVQRYPMPRAPMMPPPGIPAGAMGDRMRPSQRPMASRRARRLAGAQIAGIPRGAYRR